MVIDRIHINAFGALRDKELSFSAGLNIIEGENESGKTTIATFIRFVFYGFTDTRDASRYLAFSDGTLSGTLDCTLCDGDGIKHSYRISRTLDAAYAETDITGKAVLYRLKEDDTEEEMPLPEDLSPGAYFFGVNAQVFASTAFVRQAAAASRKPSGTRVSGNTVRCAIDNILFSANENLDSAAAVARLSEQRDRLFNAEARRGSIYDLERRRSVIANQIKETRAMDDRTQETVQAIADCESRIRMNTERSEQLRKIYSQYELYKKLDQTDTLDDLHLKKASAEKRAAALTATMFRGNYTPDADFASSLHLCADDMREAKENEKKTTEDLEKIDFSARRDNLKENLLRRIETDGGVDALRAQLDRIFGKRAVITVCGVLFLIVTVLSLAATAFFLILHSSYVETLVFITAILAAFAGTFFIIRSHYEKALKAILNRYSCTTEEELDNFLEEYILSQSQFHQNAEQREKADDTLSNCAFRYGEAARQAALLLCKLQPPDAPKITPERLNADIVETAASRIDRTLGEIDRQRAHARACQDEIDRIAASMGMADETALTERLNALRAAFGGKSSADVNMDAVVRELDFNMKSNASLQQRIVSLREKLKNGNPSAEESLPAGNAEQFGITPDADPGEMEDLLAEIDQKLHRDRRTYAALTLAIEKLQTASGRLHDEIAPRLMTHAGMLMRMLSDWRYEELDLDEDMHMTYPSEDGDALPVEFLSAGTQDLAYLSLRMALVHMLYPKQLPPLLFDEAFTTLDDKRLTRMVELLFRSASPDPDTKDSRTTQALVFTCHKRESHAAETAHHADACRVIQL